MFIDFVPLASYTTIYFQALLVIFLIVFFELQRGLFKGYKTGGLIMILIIVYMGLRPVSGWMFGDMAVYSRYFEMYASGMPILSQKDLLFHGFIKTCSSIMGVHSFFLLCAALYVYPSYVISKKWFKEYWFYAFLMIVGSFSFWAAGTNGIRNGIASAFFLLALSRDKKIFQGFWLLIAVNFHAAMYLPALGLIFTWFYNNSKAYYIFWFLSIPLSLALPGFWENLFGSLVEGDRAAYFLDENQDEISTTGFRWDFLIYSATGVFAGWYYIFKKKLNDITYHRLFNIYLFANAFWILVIRANFSNRFAYLSWFLLALVVAYPWLKGHFTNMHARKFSYIFIGYFIFTYFMNVIIYG